MFGCLGLCGFRLWGSTALMLGPEDHLSVLLKTYLPSPVINPNSKTLGPKQSDFVSGIRGSRGFLSG